MCCYICGGRRRAAAEIIDPKTEETHHYCEPCARRVALGCLFKRRLPPVRRVHADDAALQFETVIE